MPTSPLQRAKLLYLMKILLEKTDEDHPLTMNELSAELSAYDIKVERKTLYADIELLSLFGLDIEKQRDKSVSYYIANRQFELPELKLLVDAVQSSRFITEKKSKELIKKLSSLTSATQAGQLNRHVYVTGRAKSANESAYYSVDAIHSAINTGKQIAFKYFDYDIKKDRVYRKNGNMYMVAPITLCWNDDKYYLIAYNPEQEELRHYRVDRMIAVNVVDEPACLFDKDSFDAAEHIGQVFGMYGGEVVRAVLSFDNSLVNVVLDHFGKTAKLIPADDGWFDISVDVSVSPVFLGWVFQFGGRAVIKGPDSLIAAMRELTEANAHKYRI